MQCALKLRRSQFILSETLKPKHNFQYVRRFSESLPSDKPVMITTPIFYVNSSPHIGHLYSCLIADSIARWNRFKGNKTLFMTGTDEHGLKVQQAAEKLGKTPETFCNDISNEFRSLFDKAQISYDDFIRTTEPRHKKAVHHLWQELEKKGLLYLGKYEGWYCVSDESFLTPDQVKDVVDPKTGNTHKVSLESGHKVEWVIEENYKFKLSAFREPLLRWLDENPNVITPSFRQEEVRYFMKKLDDLSVSRSGSRIKWALEVPNDPKHTIYVWLDALTNYLTVTGYPEAGYEKYWPADYHIIGKDILKFHGVYWPAFLLGAGLPLPKKMVSHAYWTVDHVKMSKSLGNVVHPSEIIQTYGLDPLRYFLLSNGGIADDGDFSYSMLFLRLKGDLADNFGNLISRSMTQNFVPNGVLPNCGELTNDDKELVESFNKLPEIVNTHYTNANISLAVEAAMAGVVNLNRYFNKNEPWKLRKKPEEKPRLDTVIYVTLEGLRICSLLLTPIMPQSMSAILDRLGVTPEERTYKHAKFGRNPGVPIKTNSDFKAFVIPDLK